MIISHIAAMSDNRVIGRAGGLPWHIPEDFKFFKQTTLGHIMIMGRKTFASVGKPLPGRLNLVISRQPALELLQQENLLFCSTLQEALQIAESLTPQWGDEVFIGGGGEIYQQSITIVERIYLTRVHQQVEGDTFYPEFDEALFSKQLLQEQSLPVAFSICLYQRLR